MSFFSESYFQARERFRLASTQLGWQHEAHAIEARGPQGEELTLDFSASPAPADAPILLITSGVHGVEGFFGSAVQLMILEELKTSPLPAGSRVVMIHGISPYGFAFRRRFDENNVDPNRNFLLPGQEFRGSPPLYAECDPYLNPKHPPRWPDGFLFQTAWFAIRHGYPALKQAIAGGQYDFPKGLFYGGAKPSDSSVILKREWPRWFSRASRVVHLDFHTGLGAWATYKLLIDPPLSPQHMTLASQAFGASHLQEASPLGIDYHTIGGFGSWCVQQIPEQDYLHLCAEFGTFQTIKVVSALRRENQILHWAPSDFQALEQARKNLLESFVPSSIGWRNNTLKQAKTLLFQAFSLIS
jgi:hypothetical protein